MAAKFSFILLVFVAGCHNYQVSLNEQPIYRPPGIVHPTHATDTALSQCLSQWLSDHRITQAKQLTTLICSHAGIMQSRGLNQFIGLVSINLADNELRSLDDFDGLTQLQHLDLANNDLTQLQPLFTLPRLKWLNVAGNAGLDCQEVKQLANVSQAEVVAPRHCR